LESLKPKTITVRIAGPAKRLAELDALRCFLSWWVVLDHLLLFSGYRYETLPSFVRILERGDYAVDVFIILSGFVGTQSRFPGCVLPLVDWLRRWRGESLLCEWGEKPPEKTRSPLRHASWQESKNSKMGRHGGRPSL